MKEPQILAAVQWAGKQAKATNVDMGLGPEPPGFFFSFPKRPLASGYRLSSSPVLSEGGELSE